MVTKTFLGDSVSAPLTFQQESWWKYIQLHGDWNTGMYVFALRLSGSIDCELLRKSLDQLIRRHDSLRTRIVEISGVGQQHIDRPAEFLLEIIPFEKAPALENEANARSFIHEFFSRSVDRAAGFFFEVRLLKLSQREHVLVLGIHHIISDAYSLLILFRELWGTYCDLVEGVEISRTEPDNFSEHAAWQRKCDLEWVEKRPFYWKEHLAGAMPAYVLQPQMGNAKTGTRLTKFDLHFDSVLVSKVRALAKQARCLSAAMVMLTACAVVLSRWCCQKDFVTWFTVSGRQLPQHRGMIGCFPYNLPLRIKINGTETFFELLTNITQECYLALTHPGFISTSVLDRLLEGGATFNWSRGPLDELSMPSRAVQDRLAPHLAVQSFIPAGLKGLDDLTEENGTPYSPEYLGISMFFFDGAAGFSATLIFSERFLTDVQVFSRDLQLATQAFVSNPNACVLTDLGRRQS